MFHNQYGVKSNDLRNRFADGRYSEAGEDVWSEQPIRQGFESAVGFVAKSNWATVTGGAASS